MGKMRTRILTDGNITQRLSAQVSGRTFTRGADLRGCQPGGVWMTPMWHVALKRVSHLPHIAVLRWLLARRIMMQSKRGDGPGYRLWTWFIGC